MGSDSGSSKAARSSAIPNNHDQLSQSGDADIDHNDRSQTGEAESPAYDSQPEDNSRPPLPDKAPPGATAEDDGWEPVWDDVHQAYYFFNRFSGGTTWTNPRVPEVPAAAVNSFDRGSEREELGAEGSHHRSRPHGGYNPAVHGDYDPTADYAQQGQAEEEAANVDYSATGTFNRFTGKWQAAALAPENFNDENKSRRQMSAFFDVDAAANSHDGKSLKAERSGKKLTKKELKAFKDKRRDKKEEKRRAWLRD